MQSQQTPKLNKQMIHPNFAPIIGQSRAKTLLSAGIEAARNGRAAIQPLITAPAGCGKTEIAHRYLDALESQGFRTMRLASPREMRLAGGTWDDFISMVMNPSAPYALYLDECHEMVTDSVKNMSTLFTFVRKAMDRTNENRDIVISEDFSTRFDRSKNVLVLSTNFLHLLDKSGALQSRFDHLSLDLYKENELKQILVKMMTQKQMSAAEESVLTLISRCGRGTARPIKNIVEQTLTVVGNTHPLTMEETMHVLKLMNLFPKGLSVEEVKLLQMCLHHEIKDNQFLATVPSVDPSQLRLFKGYLTSPEVGLLGITPRGMETTNKGRAYLSYLANKGFIEE